MSAVAPLRRPFGLRLGAAAAPVEAPARAKPRPRLVIVAPARPTPGRLPFVILIGTVLVSGLLLLLMLHTLAAQDGFKASALQQKLNALTDTEQGLAQQVQADSSPATLRQRAAALGMVPSTIPSYHRAHGGRVVGVEQPAYLPAPPTTTTSKVNPKTPPTTATNTTTNGSTTAASGTTGSTTTAGPTHGKATTATTTGTAATTTTHHHKTSTASQPSTSQKSTASQPGKPHHKPHRKPTTAQ